MFNELKTRAGLFLSSNHTVRRVCALLYGKERPCAGFRERRKKIDPRYTNPVYSGFVDRRKHSEIHPLPETGMSSLCREDPLHKYIVLLGVIAACLLLLFAMIHLYPSTENIRKNAPKTTIFE